MSQDLLEQLIQEQAPRPRTEFVEALDDRVARGFRDPSASDPIWPWVPAIARMVASLRYRPMRAIAGTMVIALVGGAIVTMPTQQRPATEGDSLPAASGALDVDDYQPAPLTGDREAFTSKSTGTGGSSTTTAVSGSIADYRRHILGSGMFLKVEPDAVPQVVADAVAIARDFDGYPGSSSYDVEGDEATGSADLWVPTDRYADALARLSRLGEVERTTQQSRDVTASRAGLVDQIARDRERLRQIDQHGDRQPDSNAQREAIANQLELRRQRLANIDRRIEMSLINVKVRGVDTPQRPAERWSIRWAVETAGDLLRATAALLIVGAGVLFVPALLVAGWWFARAARRRRVRSRTLDDE